METPKSEDLSLCAPSLIGRAGGGCKKPPQMSEYRQFAVGVDGVSLSVGPLFMRCKCTKKIHAKTAFFWARKYG